MTQVVHSEDEFQKIMDRALNLEKESIFQGEEEHPISYWIYVATKEKVAIEFYYGTE